MSTNEIMQGAKVETFKQIAHNGRFARIATKVVLADGREIRFTERVSKKVALANAAYQVERGNV